MRCLGSLKIFIKEKMFYPILSKFAKILTVGIEANFYKERFREEVKKRCELEEEIIRSKEKHHQEASEISREAVRRAVNTSFEVIKEEYYLVPKNSISFQDALRAGLGKPNILGQVPPLD